MGAMVARVGANFIDDCKELNSGRCLDAEVHQARVIAITERVIGVAAGIITGVSLAMTVSNFASYAIVVGSVRLLYSAGLFIMSHDFLIKGDQHSRQIVSPKTDATSDGSTDCEELVRPSAEQHQRIDRFSSSWIERVWLFR